MGNRFLPISVEVYFQSVMRRGDAKEIVRWELVLRYLSYSSDGGIQAYTK